MISTTTPLPLPVPNTEREDPVSPSSLETPRDDGNTLSFASRLDQRITQRSPERARPKDARASDPQSRKTDSARDEENAAAFASDTRSASSPVESEKHAGQASRPEKSVKEPEAKEHEAENETQITTAVAAAPAPAVPLTPIALAITNGIAPMPVPAANPAVTQEAASGQGITAAALVIQASPAATKVDAASTTTAGPTPVAATPANANPAATAFSAESNDSLSALPLNIPGVTMDSRAAVQPPAPGVANALPQNITASLADAVAAQTAVTNLPPAAIAPGTATAQMPAGAAAFSADSTGGAQAESATLVSGDVPNGASIQTASIPISTVQAVTIPAAPPVLSAPLDSGVTANSADANTAATSQAEKVSKENHLDGIERLLTLNTGKAAVVSSRLPSAPVPTVSAQNGANSGVVEIPATPRAHRPAEAAGIPVPVIAPTANAATPGAGLASLAASGQAPGLASDGLTADAGIGANTSVALHPGNLQQAAAGPRPGNLLQSASASEIPAAASGNSELGASTLLPSNPSSSNADTDRQEQPGAQNRPQADAPTVSGEAGTDGSATVTASSAARDAAPASAATAVTSANGSSQIDRAHVVEQVTRHMEGMRITGGNGEMRLNLAPQHLGSVQVTVSTHQDGVIARIAVESAQVQQVMEHSKEHLRSTLEARGLHVREVEVTVTPNMTGQNSAAFNEQRRQANAERAETSPAFTRSNPSRLAADNGVQAPVIAPASILSASRLDYRA